MPNAHFPLLADRVQMGDKYRRALGAHARRVLAGYSWRWPYIECERGTGDCVRAMRAMRATRDDRPARALSSSFVCAENALVWLTAERRAGAFVR